MKTARIDALLAQAPVLPVLAFDSLDHAVPLARALVAAGLPVLEVTLRSAIAVEAIRRIVGEVEGALVGAGTVLTRADLDAVRAAGAQFAISPGATPALYDAAADSDLPFLPGVATASELMAGIERGLARFKLFPASSLGGPALLKAWAGPFPGVRFCPTGGIDAASAPAWLALGNVMTVGGSWMAPAARVAAGDWAGIAALARACAALRPLPG
ncbi:MAG: bifunctional 4-hydroxy-2-oxoglutarate aldolase/2-dehydro-3-deoxy-phosphogluconate aldolase [Arenimonas sp.]|uniref:bifunctional 4-hydroxy-2-oxoglutarate aldolase/2-dehydro-3-deoxy-phosphogluconate aldolase n=1 Tax=Arenimonas sp. TaxID=1872635 RepID=UPI0025C31CB6|nr:bifunctional 4-hydroxy-2-oxoglutarate aldolase/2-dehydro-3-deoxy-phosphogluconate aldolase [Arenimonas sp.]MBW8368737.1 bifunctional 4-hydroxy-2-oxoglutarate aldolase/2-dehydro-3-deoxy-phosphogluconate aldolase [Arenimonas sp.]